MTVSFAGMDVDDVNADEGSEGENIYQSPDHVDKLDQHEAFALHYKRLLFLMAGLDAQKNLFGTFHNEPEDTRFISQRFQEEHFRFIHDDDGEFMLPLSDFQPVLEWVAEKNTYLRSGSRVLCFWDSLLTVKTAPRAVKEEYYSNHTHTTYWGRPVEESTVQIVHTDQAKLVAECPVKSTSWSSDHRLFEARSRSSGTPAPSGAYLVLDAVKSEEIERYIHDRATRINHIRSMKFFKRASLYLRE